MMMYLKRNEYCDMIAEAVLPGSSPCRREGHPTRHPSRWLPRRTFTRLDRRMRQHKENVSKSDETTLLRLSHTPHKAVSVVCGEGFGTSHQRPDNTACFRTLRLTPVLRTGLARV